MTLTAYYFSGTVHTTVGTCFEHRELSRPTVRKIKTGDWNVSREINTFMLHYIPSGVFHDLNHLFQKTGNIEMSTRRFCEICIWAGLKSRVICNPNDLDGSTIQLAQLVEF